ncbi:MAG: hypothetical protein ACIAQF_11180 [Phycisphaerales bacterium JB065]
MKWSLNLNEKVRVHPSLEVTRLRWLRYIMLTLALAGAIGAFAYQRAAVAREQMLVDQTRDTVLAIEQRIRYLKAMEEIDLNELGWPEVVDPRWFKGQPPRNNMLGARHPWLEVASTLEYALDHPVQRVAINESLAGLWYNPAKGIVRARVPQTLSDEKTIEIYNRINGSSISELFDSNPRRRILEELLEDEEDLEALEEEPRSGVRVRRPEDETPPSEDEGEEPEVDEDAPLIPDEEHDPAGPVPEDEPPASDGAPVRDEVDNDDASDEPGSNPTR